MILFSTKRLRIRLLKMEDFKQFYILQSDVEVLKYAEVNPKRSKEAILGDLKKLIEGYPSPENQLWVWAIEDQAGDFVGTCALVKGDHEHEIGYRFLRNQWGRGYGAELCKALLKYGFEVLRLQRIVAVAAKPNVASVKILDRLMQFDREEFNGDLGVVDRHYVLSYDITG